VASIDDRRPIVAAYSVPYKTNSPNGGKLGAAVRGSQQLSESVLSSSGALGFRHRV